MDGTRNSLMKRQIITAFDIKHARRDGLRELVLPAGSIVTPQARDDAKDARISLVSNNSQAIVNDSVSSIMINRKVIEGLENGENAMEHSIMPRSEISSVGRSSPPPLPDLPYLSLDGSVPVPASRAAKSCSCSDSCAGGPARPSEPQSLRREVLQRIKAKLGAAQAQSPLLEQLVDKAIKELAVPSCNGACQSCMSGAPQSDRIPAAEPSGRGRAGGVIAVDGNTLPWQRFSGASDGQVNIVDVITPADNSPMGGGYLEWNATSFPWTLAYAELDVVLEGELHITAAGPTVIGRPGDMLFIPKGTSVIFSSPGYVRFAYATWPADWSAQ